MKAKKSRNKAALNGVGIIIIFLLLLLLVDVIPARTTLCWTSCCILVRLDPPSTWPPLT